MLLPGTRVGEHEVSYGQTFLAEMSLTGASNSRDGEQ